MVAPRSGGNNEIAGSLAVDVMSFYDVELDFVPRNSISSHNMSGK